MLTVASPTGLSLNITKDDSSFAHTISGRLTSNGTGVEGKRIKLLVDGAEISVTTSSGGWFSTTVNLPPVNNGATEHTVQAVFEGDTVQNATAYATAPDGSSYPVCTTIQYVNGSESGSGSAQGGGSVMMLPMMDGDSGVAARPVTVTVQPQATTTTQPTNPCSTRNCPSHESAPQHLGVDVTRNTHTTTSTQLQPHNTPQQMVEEGVSESLPSSFEISLPASHMKPLKRCF